MYHKDFYTTRGSMFKGETRKELLKPETLGIKNIHQQYFFQIPISAK